MALAIFASTAAQAATEVLGARIGPSKNSTRVSCSISTPPSRSTRSHLQSPTGSSSTCPPLHGGLDPLRTPRGGLVRAFPVRALSGHGFARRARRLEAGGDCKGLCPAPQTRSDPPSGSGLARRLRGGVRAPCETETGRCAPARNRIDPASQTPRVAQRKDRGCRSGAWRSRPGRDRRPRHAGEAGDAEPRSGVGEKAPRVGALPGRSDPVARCLRAASNAGRDRAPAGRPTSSSRSMPIRSAGGACAALRSIRFPNGRPTVRRRGSPPRKTRPI